MGGEVPISDVQPVCDLRRSDLPSDPTNEDEIVISGTRYRIRDVQPDGEGMLACYLHAVEG